MAVTANGSLADGLFEKDDAAHFLRVSRSTIDRLIARRVLRIVKLGRRVLIRPEAIAELLETHEIAE